MCAARTADYEGELCSVKDENERPRQLLDAVCKMQPRVVQHTADVRENLHPEWEHSASPHIKEEEEDEEFHHIKEEEEEFLNIKEEEEEELFKVPLTGVPLKSEDEGQSEERREAEPPSSSKSQHMTTEGDGDHCGGSPADGLLAPLSDSDDTTSHSAHSDDDDDDDDDEELEGDMIRHTDKKPWKCSQCGKTFASQRNLERHMKIHTGEKPFACSDCGQRFSQKGTLKSHTTTHTGGECSHTGKCNVTLKKA
ncbi:zinc finger protein 177-like isoform X3 [Phyllopteryx taeniolatus]|uniref:zinc finger protein 177-like isoform X3 n=1 Tax=Phyllopteryx taeniolatus TaxID=161469 RepID=UPI002AD3B91A|nr:zinc finger protein 177-like isoform X3 [Phyllopteryx taeniolatus]